MTDTGKESSLLKFRTPEGALSMINWAGWAFVSIGGLFAFFGVRGLGDIATADGKRGILATLILTLLFAGPGGFLLTRRNRASALAMMGVSLLGLLMTILIAAGLFLDSPSAGPAVVGLIGAAIWASLGFLGWRAFQAAVALRQFRAESAARGEVFD